MIWIKQYGRFLFLRIIDLYKIEDFKTYQGHLWARCYMELKNWGSRCLWEISSFWYWQKCIFDRIWLCYPLYVQIIRYICNILNKNSDVYGGCGVFRHVKKVNIWLLFYFIPFGLKYKLWWGISYNAFQTEHGYLIIFFAKRDGQYRNHSEATPTMLRCLTYNLFYHKY